MSPAIPSEVESLGVRRQERLHDVVDGLLRDAEQQVQVVRHYAVGIKTESESCLDALKRMKKVEVILRGFKEALTPVSSSHSVVNPILYMNARWATHNIYTIQPGFCSLIREK